MISVVDRPHTTLLAFLSSGCTTCRGFWDAFAEGEADHLPGLDTHLVVVTKGSENESPAKVRELARGSVRTIMSSEAWLDYEVPVSPYFVLVDGRTGRVLGEGSGTTWEQVSGLLEQACADAGLTPTGAPSRSRRPGLGPDGPTRERRADEELARAGIGPGHPSLYGQTDPEPVGPTDEPRATPSPAPGSSGGPHPRPRREPASAPTACRSTSAGGWEGEIYLRPPDAAAATAPAAMGGRTAGQATATTQFPVLQLANFALPSRARRLRGRRSRADGGPQPVRVPVRVRPRVGGDRPVRLQHGAVAGLGRHLRAQPPATAPARAGRRPVVLHPERPAPSASTSCWAATCCAGPPCAR